MPMGVKLSVASVEKPLMTYTSSPPFLSNPSRQKSHTY